MRRMMAAWLVAWLMVAGSARVGADSRLTDAVKRGDRAALHALLADGHDATTPEPDGTTALHWAVRADDVEMARMLLEAGSDAGAANRYGVTPLSLAALNGSAALMTALLDAGADANTASPEGETVLMTAARTGRDEAVNVLLDRGAEVNARESWFGETALMWAAAENHAAVTAALVERGADLNARANEIQLPKVKVDIATMVITALPRGGLTPLLLAAREGAVEAAAVLARAGADLDAGDPDGTSPLVMAIINAHYDLAARLVEYGADPDEADSSGMGALYALVDMRTQDAMINRPFARPTGDSLSLLEALLISGADPNLPLKTPLLARQHNFGDGALGEGATPLMRAAKYADLPAMRLLLAHGADASRTTADGANAAMFAARRAGRNAASVPDTIEALRLCLDRGLDVNAVSERGDTLLHIAVGAGDDVVAFLAARGARLDLKDKAGRTPLDIALGVPGLPSGRRGGGAPTPGPVRESTAALLRQLMSQAASGADTPSPNP